MGRGNGNVHALHTRLVSGATQRDKMKIRNVAIVIFYDQDLNILVQERGEYSKVGEKYGFFGGQIKEGEEPEEAMERELLEEINFIPKDLQYWLKYSYIIPEEGLYKDWLVNCSVFLAPVTKELENCQVSEGKGMLKISLEKVIEEDGFPKNSTAFLKGLRKKLCSP